MLILSNQNRSLKKLNRTLVITFLSMNIETGNTAGPTGKRLGKLIPNPNAKLKDQFHEVAGFN